MFYLVFTSFDFREQSAIPSLRPQHLDLLALQDEFCCENCCLSSINKVSFVGNNAFKSSRQNVIVVNLMGFDKTQSLCN